MGNFIPWDWSVVSDRSVWLDPCEESYYYAEKWKRQGRKSVLDLGCGLGRHSVLFAKYGFKTTALDLSDEAIDFLKKYRREQNTDILCKTGNMNAMPFAADAFDCIFAMHSAGHCDTKGFGEILSEIKRVLKPDGTVFMTLCSKETYTFAESGLPRFDPNTVIKTEGPEKGVPHFFVDLDDIISLFADFELVKVRHINDCYYDGKRRNQKHYFIEAVLHKEPSAVDYSKIIGKTVKCRIDRPLGSIHPRFPDLKYTVNYGYVEGVFANDGAEQDVYILGVDKPLEEFTGKVIAVCHRLNDVEDKWIVVPDGISFTTEEIAAATEFQEKFFDSVICAE